MDALTETFPQGLVCLDLETTGLSPLVDEITEVAAIKWVPGKPESLFHTLINPQKPIPEKIIRINNITDLMVKNSPTISQVLPNLLSFMGNLPLVAHNAQFDLGYLMVTAHKNGREFPGNQVYCSYLMSRKALPHLPSHGLASLAHSLKIPPFTHHRALEDAKVCLKIFAHCLTVMSPGQRKALKPAFTTQPYQSLKPMDQFPDIPPCLSHFLTHIHNQTPLLIKYSGGSIKLPYRPVKPTSLLPLPHGIVLYSLCLVSNQYKSFLVKKIKEVREGTDHEIEQLIQRGKEFIKK